MHTRKSGTLCFKVRTNHVFSYAHMIDSLMVRHGA